MKILIVYHSGAVHNARQIYHELAKSDDVELTAIVPQRVRTDAVYDSTGWLCLEHEERGNGYRLVPAPLRNPSDYSRGFEIRPLQTLIRQIQPDVIQVLDEAFSNYLFQVVWQRLIAAPRSKVLFYGFENRPLRLGWRAAPWKLTWSRMAGGMTANNEAIENLRHAGFPAQLPLERIFWGISTEIFKPMDALALKEELSLDCEHLVGFVGRLVPEKGIKILQAAMSLLPPSIHCLIIGTGSLRADLKLWSKMPGIEGRVHLYDVMPQHALAKYINCMDVLAVPSLTVPHWKEQYGRVIAEAMACGRPVVGSDSGAIPEVIAFADLVIPEKNSDALAEAVHKLIFDREAKESLRSECLKRAEEEFSVKVMVERLLNFYYRVLEA